MSQPDLVGVVEAAEILGKSRATVKRLAANGTLPIALRMPGETGALLFNRADVEQLRERVA